MSVMPSLPPPIPAVTNIDQVVSTIQGIIDWTISTESRLGYFAALYKRTASLDLYAPEHLRSGLLWSARFHIHANDELKKATLVLDPGWAEGMAINTIEPSPVGEASKNGRLSFELGHIPKGQSFILFMQFQVNATNVAWRRPQNVELDDGAKRILVIHRRVTIYP